MPLILTAGKFGFRASFSPFAFEMRSTLADPDRWLVELAGGSPTGSGQTITERIAMQLTGVFSAVDLISKSLAVSPLEVFEKKSDDSRVPADSHRLTKLLKQPNEEMTANTFRRAIQGHLLLWGNGFIEIERNGAGVPVALWPLRPDRTTPRRASDGSLVYDCRSDKGGTVTLDAYDVLHLMGYSYDGLRGITPIGLHRETLGLTMATQDYGGRFFGNDARPGGILSPAQPVRKEARDRIKKHWDEAHQGSANSHRLAIMEQEWKWQQIGMPNEDAQFLQTRVFQLSEIARIYHVPLHKLSELSHATFSNIEHQSIEYVTDAVLPWAHVWEEEIERKLLLPGEQDRFYVEHNLSGLMRGDMKSRFDAYSVALNNRFMNPDEVRRLENMNKLPANQGEAFFVPVTLQPLDRALAEPEPDADDPAKPTPAPADPPTPTKPPADGGGARGKLARAFAHSLEVVGERLCRKEKAALERAFGYIKPEMRKAEAARFFDTHGEYVREAFRPSIEGLADAIAEYEGKEGLQREGVRAKAIGFLDGLAHRYVEETSKRLTSTDAIAAWSSENEARCMAEATRAADYFAEVKP